MSKVLIVYANFGQGHKSAAKALEDFLNAKAYDLLDFSSNFCKKFFSYGYFFTTQKFPFLWFLIFYISKYKLIKKIIKKINILLANRFMKFILEEKPKVIITTHFFPLFFLEEVKKKLNFKIITIITDIKVHSIWINKIVDLYFVPLEHTKKDLLKYKIDKNKIISGYFPFRKGFLYEFKEEDLRKKFCIENKKDCILFLLSKFDKLSTIKYAIELLKDNFNLFLVYNNNKKIKSYLDKLNYKNVIFLKFYEKIWELFFLSSVIITKPGGLTVFEGIFLKKPFIFINFIRGQEKENMDFLIEKNVAKFMNNKYKLIEAINYFNDLKENLKQNYPIQLKDIRLILKDFI